MKKNVMMRIASILLVCVLATTCGISGTFAKYVTKAESADEARVAKWGVTITGYIDENGVNQTTNDLFKTSHNDTVVSSETKVAVVAPGTDGTLTNFDVTGTPEVDVCVSYVADLKLAGWLEDIDNDSNKDVYCPIVFTVVYKGNTTEFKIDGINILDTDDLEEAIEKYINTSCAVVYEANQPLNAVDTDLTISWSWIFHTDETNDRKDTYLGDQAAIGNAATIELEISCTITQLD